MLFEPRQGKTNILVSDLVRHKPGCTATENGYRLEISDLETRGIVLSGYVAKTKALISFAVTAKLICVFVFAYVKRWFSDDASHLLSSHFVFADNVALIDTYIIKQDKRTHFNVMYRGYSNIFVEYGFYFTE